jgi:acetylornithine deacetylase/succinyl-diaminopimelate desuccinylase-like protein
MKIAHSLMLKITHYRLFSFLLCCLFYIQSGFGQSTKLNSDQELGRSIFKELIEINTTHSVGNTTVAAEAMAKRLIAAGYPAQDVQIVGPEKVNRNLVVRLHGTGKRKPLLLLSHLDVVEARRSDWSLDPFVFTEKDGFFYGRGTSDIKDGSAILVAEFIRMKKEGFVPDRDLILALTSGEEGGDVYNGVEWLIQNKRALIDAEFCINMDAGDPQLKNGKRISRTVQISEKGVLNLQLESKNPGGHGSMPSKNNAIYHLAAGLVNMQAFDFPVQLNEVTKSYFYKMSSFETGQEASDMKSVSQDTPDSLAVMRLSKSSVYYNALMRSTCVATMLDAGHAINALPQSAKAKLNCRIMPGVPQEVILKTMNSVLADSQIVITVLNGLSPNPPSPLNPAIMQIVEKVTAKLWSGTPVIPVMETGATDGIYLRGAGIPTYGISGVAIDEDDNRAHGRDERIGVKEYYDGLEYEYVLIKAFSGL